MREILIFMKYSLFTGYNEKRNRKKNVLYIGLAGFAIGSLLMYFPIREALKYDPEIVALFYSLTISILILFGAILSGIESFSSFKSLDFVMSLPMRRSSVFAYIYMVNLISGSWSFGFLMALSVAYASATGKNPAPMVASSVLHYIFLSSIGITLISAIRGLSRSSFLRRIIYILIAIILPVMMFFVNGGTRDINKTLERMKLMMDFLKSPANITSAAVKPSVLSTIVEILLIVFCYLVFLKTSQRIETTDTMAVKKKGVGRVSMISKETKMIFRMERGAIYLVYPYVFGLIFSWNQNVVYALSTTLPLIALYTPNIAKNLMDQDILSWNYLRSLPVDVKKLIFSKMFALSIVGSLLFTVFYIVLATVKGFTLSSILSLPIASLVYAFSVPAGILESLDGGSGRYSTLLKSLPITLSSLGILIGLTIPYIAWKTPILALSTISLIYFGLVIFKKSERRLIKL